MNVCIAVQIIIRQDFCCSVYRLCASSASKSIHLVCHRLNSTSRDRGEGRSSSYSFKTSVKSHLVRLVPKCRTAEGSNPSTPEYQEAKGHPGTCLSVPLWRASNPTIHPIPESREAQGHHRLVWPQSHCPSHPRVAGSPGTSQTCMAPIPLSIPSQSCGEPRDITDMSRLSHSRQLQHHCPSHPRVVGSPGTSWTCHDCHILDSSNTTVHPIPESRGAQGHPGHVPSVPL